MIRELNDHGACAAGSLQTPDPDFEGAWFVVWM